MAVRGHLELTGPVTVDGLALSVCAWPRAGYRSGWPAWKRRASPCGAASTPPSGDRRAMVRPPPPGPHPQLHPEPAAARDRARQRAGLHEVPAALAARGPRHAPPGPGRPAVGDRTVAGVRAGRRRLGGVSLPGPGRGLPAAVAGGPLPVGRGRAGAGCRCARPRPTGQPRRGASTPSRATPVTFTLRADLPWLTLATRGERRARGTGPRGRPATCSTRLRRPWGHVLLGPARRPPGAFRSRCRRACGTWWPGASLPLTGSPPCGRCSRAARTGPAGTCPSAGASGCGPTRPTRWPCVSQARAAGRSWPLPLAPAGAPPLATDELAEHVAGQLLARWGVVFWDLALTRTWPCRGGRSSGRCAASRPGAWSGAGGS